MAEAPQNRSQLKQGIDAGKAGNKVPQGYDPGLAPLGTDAEAGGAGAAGTAGLGPGFQTTSRLKKDIDTGQTGDKIPQGFDPGLAPLGTDDEASGVRPTSLQVRMARMLERARSAFPKQPAEQGAMNPTAGYPAVWAIVGAFVAVLITLACAVFV